MKRWIHSATEVKTYRNKRNPNKYLEVHRDGYGHQSAKQYMEWKENGVNNPTGDGNLHRWYKGNIDELLEDYEEVQSCDQSALGEVVESSYDPTEADLYVVKIWYEIDPGYDAPNGPQAAEEIIQVVAGSPDEAVERAKMEWSGPIDRIEIVDINPEDTEEYIPFDSSCNIMSSIQDASPEVMKSGASIDFAWIDSYDPHEIEIVITNAFEDAGADVTAIDFYSVDYSQYPEYADKETSQVGVDFIWQPDGDYNADHIIKEIEEGFTGLGLEFLGIDFYSQMD